MSNAEVLDHMRRSARKVLIDGEWNHSRADGKFWEIDLVFEGDLVARVYDRTRVGCVVIASEFLRVLRVRAGLEPE